MNNILLFLLLLCQLLQQMCGQMNFPTAAMTAIVNNEQCLCYPGTTCPSGGGIDVRIVNTGTTCLSGQVYCCTPSVDNTNCGIRNISRPHSPGQAAYGAYPWQVAILTKGNDYLGGGVLVSPMYVLTAAHKVENYVNNPSEIKAKLGAIVLHSDSQSTTEPSVEISFSKVTLHPNYISDSNPKKQNIPYDIAVLRLCSAAPIATNPNINTACLPNGPIDALTGTRCWVTGWGKNGFNGVNQNILKEVDVPVLTNAACQTELRKTRLSENFVLDNNSMCAGGEAGKDACTGDGGSPLVCSINNGPFQVIGLVIWGIGCADSKVPGVYTNVYNYLSWIKQQMT